MRQNSRGVAGANARGVISRDRAPPTNAMDMAVTAPCGGGRGRANARGVGSAVDAVDAYFHCRFWR